MGTFLALPGWASAGPPGDRLDELPVRAAAALKLPQIGRPHTLFPLEAIAGAIRSGDERNLEFDLGNVTQLLDGTRIDPARIYGQVHFGPYPFEGKEAAYAYKRFRETSQVREGRARLALFELFEPQKNTEGWKKSGNLVVRARLYLEAEGRDRFLGTYDTFTRFRRTADGFVTLPSIVSGPFVSFLPAASAEPDRENAHDLTRVGVWFETDVPVPAQLEVAQARGLPEVRRHERPTLRHGFSLSNLERSTTYRYRITLGEGKEKADLPEASETGPAADWSYAHHFHTPPARGEGPVRFAYCGDSREGVGGGERNFLGTNYTILDRLLGQAYERKSDLLIMGGDLVNGYSVNRADFRNQLLAWKQAAAGFWRERPVYPAMGNHEALLYRFRDEKSKYGLQLDRWPYKTQSAEAVFGHEFVNPRNGPAASDPRRPTYSENVYAFQFGLVQFICFNNNYWYGSHPAKYGGSPEGYILPDQMAWIRDQVERAEKDATVSYIVLYAQEPVFPNGGHLKDAMWHRPSGGKGQADNRVRAYSYNAARKTLKREKKGIIEVRNELVALAAAHRKIAAVLGSDEHGYHKVLIDRNVPVGRMEDDTNGNGILGEAGEPISPLSELAQPTWYLVCGGGGAPYYSQEPTPWNEYWTGKDAAGLPSSERHFYYSSQANIFLFEADKERIAVRVLNPYGEEIDRIDDLMAVKTKEEP